MSWVTGTVTAAVIVYGLWRLLWATWWKVDQ